MVLLMIMVFVNTVLLNVLLVLVILTLVLHALKVNFYSTENVVPHAQFLWSMENVQISVQVVSLLLLIIIVLNVMTDVKLVLILLINVYHVYQESQAMEIVLPHAQIEPLILMEIV